MSDKLTALHRNPFYLLGATVRDDRQRVASLAEERALEVDHDACFKARSDLLNPRNRLALEVSWLPGVSPRRAAQLVERVAVDPRGIISEDGLPTLARANLLAASLEATSGADSPADVAARLVEVARVAAAVDSAEVLRDINEDRSVARFAPVASEELVTHDLAERGRYFRSVMRRSLDQLPAHQLVAAATQAITVATNGGEDHAPPLIDELVDVYEVEAQPFLLAEAENIETLLAAIRSAAIHGEAGVALLITKLASVARNWDTVAQPVQVGMQSRGIEHQMSRKIGGAIRALAIELFNEHQMLEQARRLTDLLRDVFAELPEFAERLEEDADALDDIEEARSAEKGERGEWAREITYRAQIGIVLKHELSLSPDGISWRGRTYPLDSITRLRWGAIRHSVNGIPTGTTYTIAFGDKTSESVVECRREEVYDAVVERLWKAAGIQLLLQTLRDLKDGKEWWVDGARVRDENITLYRHNFWTREPVVVSWYDVRMWSEAGAMNIASASDAKVSIALSYINSENAHILDRMLRAALNRKGLARLSELLS